jgi:hypothetical protein
MVPRAAPPRRVAGEYVPVGPGPVMVAPPAVVVAPVPYYYGYAYRPYRPYWGYRGYYRRW